MASVSGILITKLVPLPETIHIDSAANLLDIAAHNIIPTPRPEMLVTSKAVDKPGAKMRLLISA